MSYTRKTPRHEYTVERTQMQLKFSTHVRAKRTFLRSQNSIFSFIWSKIISKYIVSNRYKEITSFEV